MKVRQLLTTYVLPCLLLLLSVTVQAQTRTVTGKVSDAKNGSPLVGASVVVKGGKRGTVTDANGNFSLPVPASAKTLVISSVGYKAQELSLADGISGLQVGLQIGSSDLNDVVVIGYGSVKKKDLTGSISSVSAKDFQQGAITSPDQLIAGKIAGVAVTPSSGEPGSGSIIRIRGLTSLNGNNDPLIVIDGLPFSGNGISGVADPLATINPNDIENVTVLKDASAAAIYGSRGSSGVILITTKRGASGIPKINFNTQFSVGTVAKEESVMSASQFRNYVTTNAAAQGFGSYVSLLGNANTNWQKDIFQHALTTNSNLSISGAVKNVPYRFSLGYHDENGLLQTDWFRRGSASLSLSPRLFDDHLRVQINLNGSSTTSRFANQGAIGSAIAMDPTQPVYNPNSHYGGYWEWLQPGKDTIVSLATRNPVALLQQNFNYGYSERSFGTANLDYKFHFLPDLHAIVNLGYDISDGNGGQRQPANAAQAANNSPGPGYYSEYHSTNRNTVAEYSLNYVKDIKSIKSNINVLAGYDYYNNQNTTYNFPQFVGNGDTLTSSTPLYKSSLQENALLSYVGRMIYTFDNKYILTASIREDQSSKVGAAYRKGYFPAVAAAWRLSQEQFLKNVSWMTDLKVRASYGLTGNLDGISNYGYIPSYYLSQNGSQYQFGNTAYYMYTPSAFDANLKWEQTASTNFGLDFGFLNNRITGSVDYYHRNTTNLLNQVYIPVGDNFTNLLTINIGSMVSNGAELNLNVIPVKTKDFTWSLNFNIAYNKIRITKLTNNDKDSTFFGDATGGISGGTGNNVQIQTVGYTPNSFFVLKQVYGKNGLPIEGAYVDQNRDGVISEPYDDYHYKSPFAPVIIGFSTTVEYKRWSLSVVARSNIGNYMYNNVEANLGVSRSIFTAQGTLDNASTDLFKTNFVNNQYKSDYYVQNASFLKIDNIGLGYNVGRLFSGATLRLNANVQNAFVITKYTGIDPEVYGGIDNNIYPRPRTFTLGANVGF